MLALPIPSPPGLDPPLTLSSPMHYTFFHFSFAPTPDLPALTDIESHIGFSEKTVIPAGAANMHAIEKCLMAVLQQHAPMQHMLASFQFFLAL